MCQGLNKYGFSSFRKKKSFQCNGFVFTLINTLICTKCWERVSLSSRFTHKDHPFYGLSLTHGGEPFLDKRLTSFALLFSLSLVSMTTGRGRMQLLYCRTAVARSVFTVTHRRVAAVPPAGNGLHDPEPMLFIARLVVSEMYECCQYKRGWTQKKTNLKC